MRTPDKYIENRSTGAETHIPTEQTKRLIKQVFSLYRNGYRDREIGQIIKRTRASVRRYMAMGGGLNTFDRLCHVRNRENRKWLV